MFCIFSEDGFEEVSQCSQWYLKLTLTMSSPEKEPQGNGFSDAANTQSMRRNKLYCSDCSLEPAASHPRLLFRKSHTATPAFKCEPSPFRALSPPLSPPRYNLSFVKLPQLVSLQVSTVRETLWNEGASCVTHVRVIKPSSVGQFK